jgi:ABC-type multidrug transport system fused ATPase/permease subunit
MFIVAHRLAAVKECDLILVLDKGNIIESGTHASLLDQRGQYYNFYRQQGE